MEKQKALLKINNLKTYFPIKKGIMKKTVGYVKAVDDVSLEIYRGETLGIVGESGCGKTTLGKSILKLCPSKGEIEYLIDDEYVSLSSIPKKNYNIIRKKMQIIFQDPYSSLNPAFTIYGSLSQPLGKYGYKTKEQKRKLIGDLLETVNLPRDYMTRYPNEFSGGQRQRIGIARALSVGPELIVCDEAVSALDVSIQAQVIKLLKQLQEEKNLTYLFISHDLSVVEYISDRIAVMYLGKIVELANTDEIFKNPVHPYTKALLSAIPIADISKKSKRIPLVGDVPSPVNPPSGCPFHPRCAYCKENCKIDVPELIEINQNDTDHYVSCLYAKKFMEKTK